MGFLVLLEPGVYPLRLWYLASSLRPSSELGDTASTKLESGQTGDVALGGEPLHLLRLCQLTGSVCPVWSWAA